MPQIVSASRLFVTRKYREGIHEDVSDEILHVISGRVSIQLESGVEYTAEQSDTLFIPKGMRHRDAFEKKEGLEVFMIHFKWKNTEKLFAHTSPDCFKSLPPKEKNELLLLLDMFRMDSYLEPENLTLAEVRLAHLLGIVWRHVFFSGGSKDNGDPYSRLTAYACDYMRGHISEPLTLEQVAGHCKVSRATLLRAFHHAGNMSFNGFLRSLRMHEAYSLFKERGLNIGECALRCGYNDPGYFSRVFKKHFGFSPKNIH